MDLFTLHQFVFLILTMANCQGQETPSPDVQYGPPGFTPGEPLGYYTEEPELPRSGMDSTAPNSCKNTDLERNKRLAMDFYQTALRDKRADLMDRFLAEDYLNHSPYSNTRGRSDFQKIMTEGGLAPEPPQDVDFRRVDAIEDRVWVHSTWKLNGKQYAVMDLWTVNCDGLLQEHWDVLQDTGIPTRNPVAFF